MPGLAEPVTMEAIEPLLETLRLRRAWVRYWIHLHIIDRHGIFYKTVKTTADSVVPVWDGDGPNWLEPAPYQGTGQFPTAYQDRLLSGVRWRVMGLRTLPGNGKKRLVRVWEMDWPGRETPPNAAWLTRAGLTSEDARSDYHRLWEVINGLDRVHRALYQTAKDIRDAYLEGDKALAKQLEAISIPLPPR